MPVILDVDPYGEPSDALTAYWLALGRFMHRFALLEQQVHFLLNLETRVPASVSYAVFSGVRAKDALGFVMKIRAARKANETTGFARAVSQFAELTAFRNHVAHFGGLETESGAFVISDWFKKSPQRAKTVTIKPDILDAAVADMATISVALYFAQLQTVSQVDNDTNRAAFAQRPFLYKSLPTNAAK